ncbi:MAG: hypothetical protein A2X12_04950 [Bacteroidetes bacterium GWE2_29_8]|nr:MAG: hypothetical protein A2X12_04950 [Bacteroidetes bacterium GWE2_29_8]
MNLLDKIRYYRWCIIGRIRIKKQIRKTFLRGDKLKVIVGSFHHDYEGWIKTDYPHFDLLREKHWQYFFEQHPPDNILAEHVLEHFTVDEAKIIFLFAYKYMKKNAIFRIAVPDGLNNYPDYVESVKPQGTGIGSKDHKTLWDVYSLTKTIESVGFKTKAQEYYDKENILHFEDYDLSEGFIARSRNKGVPDLEEGYTSLIIDAIKE